MISALAMDTGLRSCAALNGKLCGIHDRRLLACRSVPFHYSRAEALAETGLEAFVATAGYQCDTSESADIVLTEGRIVPSEFATARLEAIALAERDRVWTQAIVRRMKAASSAARSLPSLPEVEANAHLGVTTTSMCVAREIAAEIGLIGSSESDALRERQLATIYRALRSDDCSPEARQALSAMRAQYEHQ